MATATLLPMQTVTETMGGHGTFPETSPFPSLPMLGNKMMLPDISSHSPASGKPDELPEQPRNMSHQVVLTDVQLSAWSRASLNQVLTRQVLDDVCKTMIRDHIDGHVFAWMLRTGRMTTMNVKGLQGHLAPKIREIFYRDFPLARPGNGTAVYLAHGSGFIPGAQQQQTPQYALQHALQPLAALPALTDLRKGQRDTSLSSDTTASSRG
eukprot:TRINITY_DN90427_c0_g1_i1.p1 TRINITY_DN90427_c0_g1~~TRINITY_DN90427_c0_g1_i1.p1  ORF type:complete len:210 (-),score=45.15 TRINITY_DN90427_c0_g1_i1:257-886(-)